MGGGAWRNVVPNDFSRDSIDQLTFQNDWSFLLWFVWIRPTMGLQYLFTSYFFVHGDVKWIGSRKSGEERPERKLDVQACN
jgi:hypothetical protein